ncbi:MAG: hypothetical protein PHI12_10905 [Dehalococcoidales bacterium]|nr:hypothetical protein [Dehalococcoidales bacterium]
MSWGERSCKDPCRALDHCDIGTCNVDCPGYEWDGKTPPDSVPMTTRLERRAASPVKLIPLMLATMMPPDSGDVFQSLVDLMPREQGGSRRTRERARKRKKARKRGEK